jgi:peptide chain release factor 2
LASKEARIKELEVLMEAPNFWDDNTKAQKAIAESNACKVWTAPYHSLKRRVDDIKELFPEAEACGDQELISELLADLQAVDETLADLEVRRMLSGEMDNSNCFLSINAGAGGTEACDWVSMLARMYQRWAVKKGWTYEVIDVVEGDVAGIKSTTVKFTGEFAYGYAKSERGVHRLVRISPFDSNAKRHTSFASVDVTPEVSDDIKIEVRPEELRVDTYRASGAGGQHVNKTDSAVRITHLPTGVIVSSQSQRSQIQNREYCMKMLKSKLYDLQLQARKKGLEALSGDKKEIAWGSQIRNYVFQPYTLVKDTRTGVEVGNVPAVMDGDIDVFVNAYLKESEGK